MTDVERTNLGRERSALLGRSAELAQLAQWWGDGYGALCTVSGTGGVGKTRLARRFARDVVDSAPPAGGVWFCDLAHARSPGEATASVARVLGVALTLGATVDEVQGQFARALAGRGDVLLVLDNLEQLVEHAAQTVGAWLDAAPACRVLATSREPLGLEGERCVELHGLAVADAVALFEARAAALGSPRRDDAGAALATLVARLGGVPLAIELAAARAEVLTPRELLARLDQRLDLLRSTRRDAHERHATLRAAIAWSWDLLAPDERATLAQCAVFRGGFTVPAAEAVVRLEPGARAVIDVVQALRRRSLLRLDDEARARLAFDESVQAFALERLAPAERDAACARHADYFAAEAEQLGAEFNGPDEPAALDALARERDNLLAALERSADVAPARAARIGLALQPLLATRGPADAQRAVLDAVLAASADDPVARARALLARGDSYRVRGALTEAQRDLDAALALAQAHGDARTEAEALRLASAVAWLSERAADARGLAERARAAHAARGDRVLEALAESDLALALQSLGDAAAAQRHHERALGALREAGSRRLEGVALNRLGALAKTLGHLDGARRAYEAALAAHREVGNRRFEGVDLHNLGSVHQELGQLDEARDAQERALAIYREVGDRRNEAAVLLHLGSLALERGHALEAGVCLEQSARIARELGQPWLETPARTRLAYRALHAGDVAEAALHATAALQGAAQSDDPATEVDALATQAAVLAARGEIDAADAHLARASARAAATRDPVPRAVVAVLGALVDLARARGATGEPAARHEADARRRRADAARSGVAPDGTAVVETSVDVRLAAWLVDRALEAHAGGPRAAAIDATPALRMRFDGAWFEARGRARVDLTRRGSLQRIAAYLLAQRDGATGAGWAELLAAGWPGETVARDAAINRVRTAVWTLRRMGLDDVLVTGADGYRFDRGASVVVVDEAP